MVGLGEMSKSLPTLSIVTGPKSLPTQPIFASILPSLSFIESKEIKTENWVMWPHTNPHSFIFFTIIANKKDTIVAPKKRKPTTTMHATCLVIIMNYFHVSNSRSRHPHLHPHPHPHPHLQFQQLKEVFIF